MTQQTRILIAGGGTGGHVFPAIAIAEALGQLVPDVVVQFVGARGKIEMEKVPRAGYRIEGLWISGLHRGQPLRNLLFPIKVGVSLMQSLSLLARFKPHATVGVGGFASWPALRMAAAKDIPVILQEQNGFAGLANKRLAAAAAKICVAYPSMERYFPAEKIQLTGNPVRALFRQDQPHRTHACRHFELDPKRPVLFLFGGSLGAASMNAALANSEDQLQAHPEIQLIWQCGKGYYEQYKKHPVARLQQVRLLPFIDQMEMAYAAADVTISRAGALTIAELAALSKAAILIPSPNVAEDHQTHNAKALTDRDAAILLPDAERDQLLAVAIDLLQDDPRRARLSQQIHTFDRPDAAQDIARAILDTLPADHREQLAYHE